MPILTTVVSVRIDRGRTLIGLVLFSIYQVVVFGMNHLLPSSHIWLHGINPIKISGPLFFSTPYKNLWALDSWSGIK